MSKESRIKYEDIEIVKNSGDGKTYWTIEIHTKFPTLREADKMGDKIYDLD